MKISVSTPRGKTSSAPELRASLTEKQGPLTKSAAGFILLDCSLNVISFNAQAVQILGYPDNVGKLAGSKPLLAEKIRSSMIAQSCPDEPVFVEEFRSGRRRYFCRAILLDTQGKETFQPSVAALLERGCSGLIPLSKVTERFNLTRREQEVLEYLLQGMRSREIASRMNLSPSTVKAFLRLIMIKMRVSSRSAIIMKILMTEML